MSTEEGVESRREGIPLDDVTESDEGLLDSEGDEVKGQTEGEFPDVGELDYDELMENEAEGNEDEVKVHISEDIEEGEVTSDEEGEIKESDDDKEDRQATSTATPINDAQSDAESGQIADSSTDKAAEKDKAEEKAAKKETNKEDRRRSSDEGNDQSSEERDGAKTGRVERRGGERSGGGGDSGEKVQTICRHFLIGKCNWGSCCRFTHEDPAKERPKLPPPDRRGPPADFRGGPLDGPWMSRGLPPPHFMHGPLGPPRDLPPHMDPRGPMPLPPPGRGGYGPPHMPPYGPMHSRDMPPGRHFDPMGRRGMDGRRPPYPPFNEGGRGGRKGGAISEVAEETEGWMRLRTVTHDYSSDEEQRVEGDLRDRLKMKRGREGDSDGERDKRPYPPRGPDDWNDPWARDVKRDRLVSKKKRKKASSSEEESSSESESETKQKKVKGRKRSESLADTSDSEEKSTKKKKKKIKKAKKQSSSSEPSDSEEEIKRKKRSTKEAGKKRKKKSRDDESSEEETKKKRKKKAARHLGSPSPPADPRRYPMRDDYFPHPPPPFPPHLSPDDRRHWPPHPHAHPLDYPPHTSHHPREPHPHHSPKTDQFGRDITKRLDYEDSRRHRQERPIPPPYDYPPPPHRPGRDHPLWDPRRRPHPFNEGHKRRRSSEDASGSPTPPADPDSDLSEEESGRGRRGKNKKSHKSSDGLTRKEKLLQELHAINKVIEKKKSKKRHH